MNQSGRSQGGFRKDCADLKGLRPAGYPQPLQLGYLQHTWNFDGPKNLVISSIPVLRAKVGIPAIYLRR